ncbi:MAG TPA: response regulator [Herpetosiphonaceae bacterium]|nr:response regulator [Herpetosiphonaceae bacterium]
MPTLLLIDDDIRVRWRLQALLSTAGYRVMLAANAVEGLSLLHTVVVDVIVCDLMLPGMPGVHFVHRVRQSPDWQTIPLVLMHSAQQAYLVPHHAVTARLPVSCSAAAMLTTLATVLGQRCGPAV